jgi:serine/threonine protein kinase
VRPRRRARFARGAQAAARLDHPGICPVFEVGHDDGFALIVMPLLRGRTLSRILAARAARDPGEAGARSSARGKVYETLTDFTFGVRPVRVLDP